MRLHCARQLVCDSLASYSPGDVYQEPSADLTTLAATVRTSLDRNSVLEQAGRHDACPADDEEVSLNRTWKHWTDVAQVAAGWVVTARDGVDDVAQTDEAAVADFQAAAYSVLRAAVGDSVKNGAVAAAEAGAIAAAEAGAIAAAEAGAIAAAEADAIAAAEVGAVAAVEVGAYAAAKVAASDTAEVAESTAVQVAM
jgi:hypothetical protein